MTHLPSFPTARPVFIVGSPRSGTSVLTWCLGQHSNILVQEESNWIGRLALQLELAYRLGTARGRRSQLSWLEVRSADFFAAFGEATNGLILRQRPVLEQRWRAHQARLEQSSLQQKPKSTSSAFQLFRDESDPKTRWVDGTPEYSFYIHPLCKLFPQARFIHLVRDVTAVVRSMLRFEETGGPPLVQNEQEAYDYWLRTVGACVAAEKAYGSNMVCRLRYDDLVEQPERSIQRVLDFLGEPFESACLEPLQHRINSSQVPSDFDPSDPQTPPAMVDSARQLNAEISQLPAHLEPDPNGMADLEKAFSERADELAQRTARPAQKNG